jgi:hypothetical protein
MSQTVIVVAIQLLVTLLPLIGINLGTEQLTNFVQVFVYIVGGLWIYVRRLQAGGINLVGKRI